MNFPDLREEEDVQQLIADGARESSTLEFKACDALENTRSKMRELAKDVSAFANSAVGGMIIYGLVENRRTNEAERIDNGYDPAQISALWIEQVIDSNIQPRIEGYEIRPISLKGANGRVLYVILIPASHRALHMANHKYYKRQNFQSKEMNEDEVREFYSREKAPGKEVVEAWRDEAINPLLDNLQAEQERLKSGNWSWNRYEGVFRGLTEPTDEKNLSANEEDFVGHHPEVASLLKEHDQALAALNNVGAELFASVAQGPCIREVLKWALSEEALLSLKAENPNRFQGETRDALVDEIIGRDLEDQKVLDYFAEWSINQHAETNIDCKVVFWQTHRNRFVACALHDDFHRKVVRAREQLFKIDQSLQELLKTLRKYLCDQVRIPLAGKRTATNEYFLPGPLRPKLY